MSRIDGLIQELCPDGVERVALGEVAELKRGTSISKKNIQTGDVPVIAGGLTPAYFIDKPNRDGEVIVVAGSGANAGFASYWDVPVFVSDAFSIQSRDEQLLLKYVFHVLKSIQDTLHELKLGGGVPHVYAKDAAGVSIPLPPLEVQEEIVRILDQFVELDRELEAEIQGREKQFEETLKRLLGGVKSYRAEAVDSIFNVSRGRVISKAHLRDNPGEFPVYSSQTQNGGIFGYIDSYDVNEESLTWTTDGAYAGAVFYHAPEERFSITNVCGLLTLKKPDEHCLKFLHSALGAEARKYVSQGMGNPKLMSTAMKKIPIPLPPLEVQEEIATKLDTFTDYIDNLKRERELRQKQYEYYRDQLLDFDVKE